MIGSLRGKSKERSPTRKVSPPEASYMDSKQFATYLAGLRENRVKRPGGALTHTSSASAITRRDTDPISPSRPSIGGSTINSDASGIAGPSRTQSDFGGPSSIRPSLAGSIASRYSTMSGRDYFQPKTSPLKPLRPDEVVPTATYMERGSRWMEKEEVVSLRTALEDMDLKDEQKKAQEAVSSDEESRLYSAALNEAAELVYQHQNGIKPLEAGTPYRYKMHLRENSYAHARTATVTNHDGDVQPTGLARDGARSVSASSSGSEGRVSLESPRTSTDGQRKSSLDSNESKSYGGSGKKVSSGGRRRSSMKRNISGEIQKPFSGDQIWEEPEGETPKADKTKIVPTPAGEPVSLRLRLRNPLNKVQFAPDSAPASAPSEGNKTAPSTVPSKPLQRIEIHRNPPSQSRNPDYTLSSPKPAGPRANDTVPKKNGMEIRADDIRQATSFKLGDRKKTLPTPSAVSDRLGRPIVSFDTNWKSPEEVAADKNPELQQEPIRLTIGTLPEQTKAAESNPKPQSSTYPQAHPPIPTFSFTPGFQAPAVPAPSSRSTPAVPSISVEGPRESRSMPAVPTIAVTPDDSPTLPSITISGDDDVPSMPIIITPDDEGSNGSPNIPIIVIPGDGDNQGGDSGTKPSARPLPTPTRKNPFMRNSRGTQGHWSAAPGSASSRATAICHECSFPIEGRFVSLRGGPERFHPQCFACYTCGTSLEALEISPEPDSFRSARLERIARRAAGETLPEEPSQTMAEDGDARLRFFCHLDWHELFAPRCKTCTTPILGEHVVALGHHFHYGHFFCAECGDPFERGMTHIEKDGYAWCVKCQTKRTERRAPKCKRCKLPVIGQYVQALGGEWHDECFRCGTCGGGFDDGQIFPVTNGVRCTDCRMKELKA